jgi:hypothetical protein
LYQAIPAVASAENNLVIFGGVIPVVVAKEMGQWRVTFGRGSGDCPAGCTKKEYFTFIVAADFSIQYVGTEKNGSGANVQ